MGLEEKVALITGAGSGIGRATAVLLAQQGVRIAGVGRTQSILDETCAAVTAQGGEAIALVGDVAVPEDMERAVERTVDRWGRLDIVFASAGVNGVLAPVEDLTPEEWNETIGINLTGTFLTLKYAVPHLKQQGGAVVITSSVNGTRQFSLIGRSAYATSKAGQVAFAKMIALELARFKVRVNVICPGGIDTNMDLHTTQRGLERVRIPVQFPEGCCPLAGRSGQPEQVARLVLFLVSDAADHITGTEVWIDGGESLLIG
jgi:NAD(P)-dependent dehydrogenase (short-subunit alcohol dehydrogenase family)